MREGLLPIGSFARAAAISVGALRHYHEAGLLRPAYVEPASGYRYYSAAQLVDAEVIARLRELEVPLDEIATVVAARDETVTARVVRTHQKRMADRAREAERIVRELHRLAVEPLRLLAERVEERALASQDVLAIEDTIALDGIGEFLGSAYAQLFTCLGLAEQAPPRPGGGHTTLVPAGPCGALYPGEDWNPSAIRVTAYVPVTRAGGEATHTPLSAESPAGLAPAKHLHLPGGRFAVGTHDGPYESIQDTYRGLGAWLAREGVTTSYDIRESYLVGPGDTDDPAEYRTEIAWPLASQSQETVS